MAPCDALAVEIDRWEMPIVDAVRLRDVLSDAGGFDDLVDLLDREIRQTTETAKWNAMTRRERDETRSRAFIARLDAEAAAREEEFSGTL